MLETLRRLLWSVPSLGALTVGLFALLTSLETTQAQLRAPRFYNSAPTSAQTASQAAVAGVLRGDGEAKAQLARLGGAALPSIMASWPARPLPERRLVAEALWPVAERMGLSSDNFWLRASGRNWGDADLPKFDEKLLFWERYRDEHASDFNPLAVQRIVKRIASSDAQLRRRELHALDTYALPALVSALGRVTDEEDVERCRRLLRYIAHATGENFQIEAQATVATAQREVTRVRVYWDEWGPQWTQLTAVERGIGRVVQTEYARWLIRTVREFSRFDHSVQTDQLVSRWAVSSRLLGACLLGLVVVGPLLSSAILVILLGARAYRIERIGLRLALTAGLVLASAWTLRPPQGSWQSLLAIAVFSGSALGAFILQRELSDRLDWRTHHLLRRRGRLSRVLAVGRWIAPAVPTLLPMAVAPAFTWVMCLELTSGLGGVSPLLLTAYTDGDWSMLMTVSLSLGVLTLVLQLLSDAVLGDGSRKVES